MNWSWSEYFLKMLIKKFDKDVKKKKKKKKNFIKAILLEGNELFISFGKKFVLISFGNLH